MLTVEKREALDQAERFAEALGPDFLYIEPQPDGVYFVWYTAEDGMECAQAFNASGPVRYEDGAWRPRSIVPDVLNLMVRIDRDREHFENWKQDAAAVGQTDFVNEVRGFDKYAAMVKAELKKIIVGGDSIGMPGVFRI